MNRRFAEFVVRRWWVVLATWTIALVVLVALAPRFGDVAVLDEAAYLPQDSAAQRGQVLIEETWPDDSFTRAVSLVFVREDRALDDADEAVVKDLVAWLRSGDAPDVLGPVTTHLEEPALASSLAAADGQAWIVLVGMDAAPYSEVGGASLHALRERVHGEAAPDGLERYVTGTPAMAIDEDAAIDASVARTTWLTVMLVTGLLLYIFRAPLAMLVPLVTVATGYVVSLSVVSLLAARGLEVSFLYQTFAVVIVFGAGTDYSLLMMTRYAEELETVESAETGRVRGAALATTIAVLVGALASAAGSTVTGFSAQAVAEFGLFRTMGPALAISVALTLLAGLTLTPALMRLAGPLLFWPRRFSRPPPTHRPHPSGEQAGVHA